TFTPVTMALRRDDVARLMQRPQLGEFLATLLPVGGVTALIFSQNQYPVLFLVFPAMLLMAMRFGFGGTAIAVVLVVVLTVGYTPEEFLGTTYRSLVHPDDRERIVEELAERAESRNRATVTYRALRSDGAQIWVDALVCTFQDREFARLVRSLGIPEQVDGGA